MWEWLVILPPPVGRKSLKPQLNQIRAWVRQGRTDAWIAHQLDVSVKEIDAFKRENELASGEGGTQNAQTAGSEGTGEELDLRAEDDALVAAELDEEPDAGESEQPATQKRRRRRGRRGGRGRRTREDEARLEATFDHGTDGYGLWLDPAICDEPVYAEHWAGHRSVVITIEPDRIIIERAQGPQDAAASDTEDPDED